MPAPDEASPLPVSAISVPPVIDWARRAAKTQSTFYTIGPPLRKRPRCAGEKFDATYYNTQCGVQWARVNGDRLIVGVSGFTGYRMINFAAAGFPALGNLSTGDGNTGLGVLLICLLLVVVIVIGAAGAILAPRITHWTRKVDRAVLDKIAKLVGMTGEELMQQHRINHPVLTSDRFEILFVRVGSGIIAIASFVILMLVIVAWIGQNWD